MYDIHQDQTKAVANGMRVAILQWLKDPEAHFAHQETGKPSEIGVCVTLLAEKANLKQPTVSRHLELLKRANFVKVKRIGKWSFYSRNEDGIAQFREWVNEQL
ncbi:MAG: metalloregulator ArsR/SmtB family transcription factor [Chloroflexota bacterium]